MGTLTSTSPLASQIAIAKSSGIDIVEVRLDGFSNIRGPFQCVQEFGRNLLREIKTKTKLPVLLTFRSADEGGGHSKSTVNDAKRAEILARLLPSVEMVDVEIRHREFARRMTVIGHIHSVDVIHSLHNFSNPGRQATMERWAAVSEQLKGDVFKVAVMARSNDDLEAFLNWGRTLRNKRKILIGMGSAGLMSRVAGHFFGSILTYGHLGRSAAPGQMVARDLVRSVRDVYGTP